MILKDVHMSIEKVVHLVTQKTKVIYTSTQRERADLLIAHLPTKLVEESGLSPSQSNTIIRASGSTSALAVMSN